MDPTVAALVRSWSWRADVLLVLAALGAIYLGGWAALRRRGAPSAPAWAPGAYLAGLTLVAVALLSPIDTFASWLFALHMVQHELLVMAAPPLLLLANPLAAMLWGLPAWLRRRVGRGLVPGAAPRQAWSVVTLMPVAWLLHVGTLWAWHYPPAYGASLRSGMVHDAQHLTFFLTAVLFWWPVVNPAPRLKGHIPYAFRIAYVIVATIQNTALALILAATERVLYPHYAAMPRLWGLTALDDQALGGAIMWIVGGMMYLAATLVLVARAMDHADVEARALRRIFGGTSA